LPLILEPLSRYARASEAGAEAFGIGMIGFSLGPGLEVTTTGVIGCAGGRTLEFASVLTFLSGSFENSAIVYQLLAGNLAQAGSGRTYPPDRTSVHAFAINGYHLRSQISSFFLNAFSAP
jgi:hypothetical protein